jgi:hypothetical protein
MTPEEELARSLVTKEEIDILYEEYKNQIKDLSPEELKKFKKEIDDLYRELMG